MAEIWWDTVLGEWQSAGQHDVAQRRVSHPAEVLVRVGSRRSGQRQEDDKRQAASARQH